MVDRCYSCWKSEEVMITIQELLYNRGLKRNEKIKLVRHQEDWGSDNTYDWYVRDRKEFLWKYQREQGRPVFHGVDNIVSFIGEEGTLARLIGVFRVKGFRKGKKRYYYRLEERREFNDLRDKVIIDWGRGTLSWHQWIKREKEVVEIQKGFGYEPFGDYLDFVISFRQLKEVINKGYRDWKKMLKAANGVYLITDTKTGRLYVGAAYGTNGIWGRWMSYIHTNGHGNNKMLKLLIKNKKDYAKYFNFSILMLLPKTVTADEAIRKERLFKKKLGTNAFGLNLN